MRVFHDAAYNDTGLDFETTRKASAIAYGTDRAA